METEDPIVICILPSVFNPKSNGHFIYLDFCFSLIGEVRNIIFISNDSRYAHGEIGRRTHERYIERFAGFYMTEQEFSTLLTPAMAQKIWLVLPDHIEGLESILVHFLRSDPHVIGCINVMLAPPFALAGNSKGSTAKEDFCYKLGRDHFVFYSRFYSNYSCMEELYIEPLPSLVASTKYFNTATSAPTYDRNLITFYLGKGVIGYSEEVVRVMEGLKDLGGPVEPTLITRAWPASKKEYIEILRRSLCLITYDPITNVERDALSQGAPVLDVNPVTAKQWLPNSNAVEILECIRTKGFDQIAQTYQDYSRACIKTNKINFMLFASVVSSLVNHGEVNKDYLLQYTPELENSFLTLHNKLQSYFANTQQAGSQELLNVNDVISIATTPC